MVQLNTKIEWNKTETRNVNSTSTLELDPRAVHTIELIVNAQLMTVQIQYLQTTPRFFFVFPKINCMDFRQIGWIARAFILSCWLVVVLYPIAYHSTMSSEYSKLPIKNVISWTLFVPLPFGNGNVTIDIVTCFVSGSQILLADSAV